MAWPWDPPLIHARASRTVPPRHRSPAGARRERRNSSAAFHCEYFEDEINSRVDYRTDVLTEEFNNWVATLEKTETTN